MAVFQCFPETAGEHDLSANTQVNLEQISKDWQQHARNNMLYKCIQLAVALVLKVAQENMNSQLERIAEKKKSRLVKKTQWSQK